MEERSRYSTLYEQCYRHLSGELLAMLISRQIPVIEQNKWVLALAPIFARAKHRTPRKRLLRRLAWNRLYYNKLQPGCEVISGIKVINWIWCICSIAYFRHPNVYEKLLFDGCCAVPIQHQTKYCSDNANIGT